MSDDAAGGVPLERGVRRWVPICVAVLDGATYEDMAKANGVTKARVRQLVGNALRAAQRRAPDRDWNWLDRIKDLRGRPDVKAAVLALLNEGPSLGRNWRE